MLQNSLKIKAMFESCVEPCIERTSFDFLFEDFFNNLPLEIIIYCVTEEPSITLSSRSVLIFRFSVLFFSEIGELLDEHGEKLCKLAAK